MYVSKNSINLNWELPKTLESIYKANYKEINLTRWEIATI